MMIVYVVYVDEIVIKDDYMEEIRMLESALGRESEVKDLMYLVDKEVARSRKGIVVSQGKPTLDLFRETRMLQCKLVDTPVDAIYKLGLKIRSVPS